MRALQDVERPAQLLLAGLLAASDSSAPPSRSSRPRSRRSLPFDRLSDFDEVEGYLQGYAAAYPDWVELESIGKSAEGATCGS